MSWFSRKRGASDEALKALAAAKERVLEAEILRIRADRISAQLEVHRRSNGFSEIVSQLYKEAK